MGTRKRASRSDKIAMAGRGKGAVRLFSPFIVVAAIACNCAPAAAEEEDWAYAVINKGLAERGEVSDRGERSERWRHRREAAYAIDPDDDDVRPQRRSMSRRGPATPRSTVERRQRTRLASLGREVAPTPRPQRPVAAIQPPRPPAENKPAQKLGPMVASLGRDVVAPPPAALPPLSGGSPIRWVASADCLARPLRGVLAQVAASFGAIRVNSTCRSKRHNARVGGAPRSYHLTGNAVDFRVSANPSAVLQFLTGNRVVGGLKHYGFGLFHIDTGPRRTWASRKRYRR